MEVRFNVAVDAQATIASDGYVRALDREIAFNHLAGLDVWGHRGALLPRIQFGRNDFRGLWIGSAERHNYSSQRRRVFTRLAVALPGARWLRQAPVRLPVAIGLGVAFVAPMQCLDLRVRGYSEMLLSGQTRRT